MNSSDSKKVIVLVRGGVVQNVYSNIHDLDVTVLDYDDIDVNRSKRFRDAECIVDNVIRQYPTGDCSAEFKEVY